MKRIKFIFVFLMFICFLCTGCNTNIEEEKPETPVEEYFQYYYTESDLKSTSTKTKSLSNAFKERIGYTFLGVFNYPSGNGIQYFTKKGSLTEGLVLTSESILYARWELKTYKINFKVGNDVFKVITKTYGDSFELVEVPEKQGYTFVGWADKNGNLFTNSLGYFECEKQTFSKESGYDFSNNSDSVTLYAKFSINTYQVTYDYLGKGNNEKISVEYGSVLTLPKKLNLQNYELMGWSYTNPMHSTQYYDGEKIDKDITLYAVWIEFKDIPIIYENTLIQTIRLYNNGYSQNLADITLNLFPKYKINGWYSNSSLSGSTKLTRISFNDNYSALYLDLEKNTTTINGIKELINYSNKLNDGYILKNSLAETFVVLNLNSTDEGQPLKIYIPNGINELTIVSDNFSNLYEHCLEFMDGKNSTIKLVLENYTTIGFKGNPTLKVPNKSKLVLEARGNYVGVKAAANQTAINCSNLDIINNSKEFEIAGGDGSLDVLDGSNGIVADCLSINGDGILNIKGGNGHTGSNGINASSNGQTGSNGGNGGSAVIIQNELHASSNGVVQLFAGNGGNGGSGGDGSAGTNGATTSNRDSVQNGGNGGAGGNGGNGGNSGMAILFSKPTNSSIKIEGTIILYDGQGGNGGNGGNGGAGGNGSTLDQSGQMTALGKPGGNGGNGGAGGNGGNGGNSIKTNIPSASTIFFTIMPSENGSIGAGGNGGAGGHGGPGNWNNIWDRNIMYGSNGTGGKGGDGNPEGKNG